MPSDSEKVRCCVCGFLKERSVCQVLILTEAEKAVFVRMGATVPEEVVYCRPCHRILTDKEQGARLLQGMLQQGLRPYNPKKAEEQGDRLYRFLMERAKPKPVS